MSDVVAETHYEFTNDFPLGHERHMLALPEHVEQVALQATHVLLDVK